MASYPPNDASGRYNGTMKKVVLKRKILNFTFNKLFLDYYWRLRNGT